MDVKQVQYCPQCHTLHDSVSAVCGVCQGTMRPPQPEDMVILATDKEFEINSLCAALSEAGFPFEEKLPKVSLSSYQGRGFKGETSIFVRYQDLDAAKRIARRQGFRFPDDPVVTPLDEEAAVAVGSKTAPKQASQQVAPPANAGQKSRPEAQEEEISPFKKKMGKVLLFATVIAAIIAVVFLSDWITGLFKGNRGEENASSAAETSAAQSVASSSEAASSAENSER